MKNLLFLFFLLSSNIILAQNSKFLEIIEKYIAENNFNGSVLVATNGNIDFVKTIGLANREHNVKMTGDSKFKLASVTKVFTAVLTMKLVEEKKIDLHETIGKYLPEFKGDWKGEITIHNLLTYSSGLENKLDKLGMRPYQSDCTLDEFIENYCSGNQSYKPGEKSMYGNTEYILLHKIIEKVSNEPYENYLQDVIIDPLGLKSTQLLKSSDIIKGLCSAYLFNDSLNTFYLEAPYYPNLYFGAGAIYSTAQDLLKFDQTLFNNKLLSEELTNKMLTSYPEYGYTAYGLWGSSGWGTFNETFYYRTGSIQGANANWIHTVDNGKTIIVLSNTNATNLIEMSEELYLESLKK